MKLSIITINLNNRIGLQRTIESVINQTFTDYEWIVIDGGSTDGSKELIERYSEHFAYWVSEPDKGIYNAMNKGIKVAKGDYLQFLNSGDWLANEDVIKDIINDSFSGDIIYGNLFEIHGDKTVKIEFESKLSLSTLYYSSIPHPSSFIRRELLINNCYSEDFEIVSDWKFFIECALKGYKFIHSEVFVSCFDISGISTNNLQKQKKEREIVIKKTVPECIQKDMKELDKLRHTYEDQLYEIDTFRHRNRFFKKFFTFILLVIKTLDKIFYRKDI